MTRGRALVTGASEGIGRAFAVRLAREGFTVIAVARNEARLHELAGEAPGASFEIVVADLATEAGVASTCAALAGEHCTLLINNAGFGAYGDVVAITAERQDEMIRVNVLALASLARAFLAQAREGDALVNLSSVVGHVPLPAQPVYAATKAFVSSLSAALWQRWKRRGVYVLDLSPGSTRTQFRERAGGEPYARTFALDSAERVVELAMRALRDRRRPLVVCGALNRAWVGVARVIPRRWMLALLDRARR